MHKVNGFTIIEISIALLVMSMLVALATPAVMNWIQSASVRSAAEFYAEGLQMARIEAIRRNASARFVLNTPDTNGWSVDWCQASTGQPCNAGGTWTNIVQRAGAAYSSLTLTFCPGGSTEIDFTSVGWVNTQVNIPLSAIRITPSSSEVRSSQIEIPLSGIPSVCSPEATAGDSRICQVVCP